MRMWRTMFSISTIASSTSTPATRLSASRVMKLSVKPIRSMIQKVGIADSGMASAEITVARRSRRNRNTTTTASTAPSIIACSAALYCSIVNLVELKRLMKWILGFSFAISASAFSVSL